MTATQQVTHHVNLIVDFGPLEDEVDCYEGETTARIWFGRDLTDEEWATAKTCIDQLKTCEDERRDGTK